MASFEHKKNKLLPCKLFLIRLIKHFGFSMLLVGFALFKGCWGYHHFAGTDWITSFYNASMILTGMGPVTEMLTTSAKLFSSFYALFSGIAFLTTIAIFFAPIAHRILHSFDIEIDEYKS